MIYSMFKKVSIKRQLFLLILSGIVSLLIVGSIAIFSSFMLKNQWNDFIKITYKKQDLLIHIRTEIGYGGLIHSFKNYLLRHEKKYAERLEHSNTKITNYVAEYKKMPNLSPAEIKSLDRMQELMDTYRSAIITVEKLYSEGKSIHEIDKAIRINDDPYREALTTLSSENKKHLDEDTSELHQLLDHIFIIIVAILILAFLLFAIITIGIINHTIKPIKKLHTAVEGLSHGEANLKQRIESDEQFGNEVGEVGHFFNRFISRLQNLISNVLENIKQVSKLSDDLNNNAHKIAQETTQQNQLADSISHNIQNMTEHLQQVAESASVAQKLTYEGVKIGQKGNQYVKSTVDEITKVADTVKQSVNDIQRLHQRSNEISGIVKVIREIADQTNLLALNAAIEAARAGDSGRGFAVVADEVRKLAERTAISTTEINNMVSTIQSETENVVNIIENSSTQVQSSVEKMKTMVELFDQVQSGSSHALEQVNLVAEAVRQQNQMGLNTAESVESILKLIQNNNNLLENNNNLIIEMNKSLMELTSHTQEFKA